jgi:anti-sigma regulatory factor (Ser/Thr protein kinase)
MVEVAGEANDRLEIGFDRNDLTRTRHTLADRLTALGLDAGRLDGFVLAVNEIMTNAVRHGGGVGRLRMWRTPGRVWCEVRDFGTGGPLRTINGCVLPPTSATSGRGLWLAQELSDTFRVETGAQGTVVRLAVVLAEVI